MENSNLSRRVLMEIENLIARSCPKEKVLQKFKNLHIAILKNHYNAAEFVLDYHRRRVTLYVVMDDRDYDPKKVNLNLPILLANLWYLNLYDF